MHFVRAGIVRAGIVASVLALSLGLGRGQAPSSAPAETLRTLDQCETDVLDLRAALVDAQEQVALWQARAISAEAKLARQAIAAARAARQPQEPQP